MIETTRTFTPDWVSSPGDAIADLLEERQQPRIEMTGLLA